MGRLDKILNYIVFGIAIIFVMIAGACYNNNKITMMVVCLGTASVLAIQCKIDEIIFIEEEEE